MDKSQIDAILQAHKEWLADSTKGTRAYLQGADLRRADLQGADLRRADLQGADLQGADLQGADLRGADLRGADLRGAIYERTNWLAWLGIIPDSRGYARAYKMTTAQGFGPYQGGVNYLGKPRVTAANLDKNTQHDCGEGINLATLSWCLNNRGDPSYRLFMMEFKVSRSNTCCPIASDGKFRVKSAKRIGECNWEGTLL